MNFTLGDGIAFAATLWFITWLLAKLFPLVFGGDVEDWLALKKEELDRKWASFAKMKNDEAERRRAAKAARDAAHQVPFRTRIDDAQDVLTEPTEIRPRRTHDPFDKGRA